MVQMATKLDLYHKYPLNNPNKPVLCKDGRYHSTFFIGFEFKPHKKTKSVT